MSAITNNTWIIEPATWKAKPRSQKIKRIAAIVHNMRVSIAGNPAAD
jgi:hypothetical protein